MKRLISILLSATLALSGMGVHERREERELANSMPEAESITPEDGAAAEEGKIGKEKTGEKGVQKNDVVS